MNFFRLAVVTLGLAAACGQRSDPTPDPTPTPTPTPDPSPDPKPDPDPNPSPAGKCGVCSVTTDDELRAHHAKVTSEPLDDHCIRRIERGPFTGAIVVGAFAHDRGCIPTGVHHQCCFHDDMRRAAAPLLAAAGWASADESRRTALVLSFTADVLNTFNGHFLDAPPQDWPATGKAFSPPGAEPAPGGAFVVHGWIQEPAGMIKESRYNLVQIRYDSSGNHVGGEHLDTIVVR